MIFGVRSSAENAVVISAATTINSKEYVAIVLPADATKAIGDGVNTTLEAEFPSIDCQDSLFTVYETATNQEIKTGAQVLSATRIQITTKAAYPLNGLVVSVKIASASELVGGSASMVLTHSENSVDMAVAVIQAVTGVLMGTGLEFTSNNSLTVSTVAIPPANEYRVLYYKLSTSSNADNDQRYLAVSGDNWADAAGTLPPTVLINSSLIWSAIINTTGAITAGGAVTAGAFVGDGSLVTDVDAQKLDGLDSTAFALDSLVDAHIAATGAHGAGVVVGTTETQALTNKTINADLNTISNIENADIKTGAAIDAAKINTGVVSNTEFNYLDGVTSAIQGQIDGKAASSHAHSASDVTSNALHPARGGLGRDISALNGLLKIYAGSTSVVNDNSTLWDTSYNDRLKWDGGATGLTAATGRTSLGLGSAALRAAEDSLSNGENLPDGAAIIAYVTSKGYITSANDSVSGSELEPLFSGITGILIKSSSGTFSTITDNSANWNTAYSTIISNASNWNDAYSDRKTWDGGGTYLDASAGRSVLGLGSAAQSNTADSVGSNSNLPKNTAVISYVAGRPISTFANDSGYIYHSLFASDGILKRTSYGNYGIVTDNSANWNTAYGWGDHSSVGYFKKDGSVTATGNFNLGGYFLNDTKKVSGNSTNGLTIETGGASRSISFTAGGSEMAYLTSTGLFASNYLSASQLQLNFPTLDLYLDDAGQVGATEYRWIKVNIGGSDGYIRVYSTK